MTKYSQIVTSTNSPQNEKDFNSNQVQNRAGGFVYEITPMQKLDRFLILGTESNTYYSKAKELTIDSAENIINLVKSSDQTGIDVVNRIIEISDQGRAAKNDMAIFALAIASSYGTPNTRAYALSKLNNVCRTGTHLFQFVEDVKKMRGWGRALRKAVSNWYLDKEPKNLGYQLMKYKQRNNWTHKDVLRLSHAKPVNVQHQKMLEAVFKGFETYLDADQFSVGMNLEKIVGNDLNKATNLIRTYNLPREVVPTYMLNDPAVWDALIDANMGLTAILRNLGKMTSIGYLQFGSKSVDSLIDKLTNDEAIVRSRIHPINVLAGLLVYKSGKGYKGKNVWNPISRIVDALEDMFYKAFKNVEPTGLRHLVAVDVSGSMEWQGVAGYDYLTPAMVAAAMSLIFVKTEKNVEVRAFSDRLVNLGITSKSSLWDVVDITSQMTFGRTDCSLPMLWAKKNKMEFDLFSVWTDNETWFGEIKPYVALEQYRQRSGINSKLVVCGCEASSFSIADPNDPGMLDIVGFDSAVPQLVREFALGNI